VPALCNILVQGETGAPPVALGDVLKALYAIIATDAGSGAGTSELFASGGIHSLVGCRALMYPYNCVMWAAIAADLRAEALLTHGSYLAPCLCTRGVDAQLSSCQTCIAWDCVLRRSGCWRGCWRSPRTQAATHGRESAHPCPGVCCLLTLRFTAMRLTARDSIGNRRSAWNAEFT